MLLALAVWVAAIGQREHRLNQAVSSLSVTLQEQAYRRAHDELATTCSAAPNLDGHCRDEAEFILRLPQCTDTCQALARRFLSGATK